MLLRSRATRPQLAAFLPLMLLPMIAACGASGAFQAPDGQRGHAPPHHETPPPHHAPPPPDHHLHPSRRWSAEAHGSIVNTTYNTYRNANGSWSATMGPLTPNRNGGIVCDHVSSQYREGDYAMWFVAPSDAEALGLRSCQPNPWGGEPTCSENYQHCGQAVRVTCTDPQWCADAGGSASIYADFVAGKPPVNNYIPQVYVDMLRSKYGYSAPRPKSVILYITDFCPRLHSANRSSGNCQGPQVDISTAAFLLLGRRNPQGYINSSVSYKVEMLDYEPATLGPEL